MRPKNKINKESLVSILEIFVLIISLFAFAFILGQDFKSVSADGVSSKNKKSTPSILPVIGVGVGGYEAATHAATIAKFLGFSTPVKGVTSPYAISVVQAAGYALTVASIAYFILGLKIGGYSVSGGAQAGIALASGLAYFAATQFFGAGLLSLTALGPAALILIIGFSIFGSKTKVEWVSYTCSPWEPPLAGHDCGKCNNLGTPCNEYQCKSLGKACSLTPPDENGNSKCYWKNEHDVSSPVISSDQALLDSGFKYVKETQEGVYITYTGSKETSSKNGIKCIPAFTGFQFGIKTNEPSQCKAGINRGNSFENMGAGYLSGSFTKNHSATLAFPSMGSLKALGITLKNGNKIDLYIKCQDENGNENKASFGIEFCINNGPDITPTVINGSNPESGVFLKYNKTELKNFKLNINEPSTCRWSRIDKDYSAMPNNLSCPNSSLEFNPDLSYTCLANLTGIKSGPSKNDFYFRCKDQPQFVGDHCEDYKPPSPINGVTSTENNCSFFGKGCELMPNPLGGNEICRSKRNVDLSSYKFIAKGTNLLIIDSVSPNDTILTGTVSPISVNLKAQTSVGAEEGKSVCSYKGNFTGDSYINFYGDGITDYNAEHSQNLSLVSGNYSYSIKCTDLAGNQATKKISFRVKIDDSPPIVTRAYEKDNFLILKTDERAACVYTGKDCSYKFYEGNSMSDVSSKIYSADWNPSETYYIKCEDDYGNEPPTNTCSIILNPSDIGSKAAKTDSTSF